MKTVMILGAGVTRAAALRTSTKHLPPLDADFFKIAKKLYKRQHDYVTSSLEKLVGDHAKVLKKSLEMSATCSYLKAINAPPTARYHVPFSTLLNLIYLVLENNTNRIETGRGSLIYNFLSTELKKLDSPSDLTIITFNYDLLIENVLEEIFDVTPEAFNFPVCYRLEGRSQTRSVRGSYPFCADGVGADGSDNNGVGILKLHGSMNWQARHDNPNPTIAELFDTKRKLHIVNTNEIHSVFDMGTQTAKILYEADHYPPYKWEAGDDACGFARTVGYGCTKIAHSQSRDYCRVFMSSTGS